MWSRRFKLSLSAFGLLGPLLLAAPAPINAWASSGAVTFSGSVAAWAKLEELMTGRPITFPWQKTFNALLFLAIAGLGTWLIVATPARAPRSARCPARR